MIENRTNRRPDPDLVFLPICLAERKIRTSDDFSPELPKAIF